MSHQHAALCLMFTPSKQKAWTLVIRGPVNDPGAGLTEHT